MNPCLYCGRLTRRKYCNDSHKQLYFQKRRMDRINNLSPEQHIREILNDDSLQGKFYALKAVIRLQERKIIKQQKMIEYLRSIAYAKNSESTLNNGYDNFRIKSVGLCCQKSRRKK